MRLASTDWNTVIFNKLTIKGIYDREMYGTWYLMQSMPQSGLDISTVITHKFPFTRFEDTFTFEYLPLLIAI